MEFWLAVTPSSSALIAHSTAGQCSVVKRAPMPSVLWPSFAPAVGKIVEPGLCSWMRFFRRSRFANVAGKAQVLPPSATPSASPAAPFPAARDSNNHAQSPVAMSSINCQVPAFVSKPLLTHCFVPAPPAFKIAASACQSRQKSGDTQGFCAMRRLCCSRKALMGVMEPDVNTCPNFLRDFFSNLMHLPSSGRDPPAAWPTAPAQFLLSFLCFSPLLAAAMSTPDSIRKARLAWWLRWGPARGFAGNVVTL